MYTELKIGIKSIVVCKVLNSGGSEGDKSKSEGKRVVEVNNKVK
jgi:hypothetical protein